MKQQRGFTLVELVVTVAILGVMITVALPTYRRFVEQARRSEAKLFLGNLYALEAAFFSEYGAYTNNLMAIGYEMPGQIWMNALALHIHTGRYNIGFNQGINVGPVMNQFIVPDMGDIFFDNLIPNLPNYIPQQSMMWVDGGLPYRFYPDSVITPNAFTAVASGIINNRPFRNWDCTYEDGDHWTMDEGRNLVHVDSPTAPDLF